jgi:hypothetical protein
MPETESEAFRRCVNEVIYHFIIDERYLLEINVSERCITHSFANYIKALVGEDWNVDVEYNRYKGAHKETDGVPESIQNDFLPDIIVHKRNTEENKLAIELKKSSNKDRKARARDITRLQGMVRSTKYHY